MIHCKWNVTLAGSNAGRTSPSPTLPSSPSPTLPHRSLIEFYRHINNSQPAEKQRGRDYWCCCLQVEASEVPAKSVQRRVGWMDGCGGGAQGNHRTKHTDGGATARDRRQWWGPLKARAPAHTHKTVTVKVSAPSGGSGLNTAHSFHPNCPSCKDTAPTF